MVGRILIVLFFLFSVRSVFAFPSVACHKSMQELYSDCLKGDFRCFGFHGFLTRLLFETLSARCQTDIPHQLVCQAMVGSIEEDVDLRECSTEPFYSELNRKLSVPGSLEVAASMLLRAKDFLQRYLSIKLQEVPDKLDSLDFWLKLVSLVMIQNLRVKFFRYVLWEYPFHRSENHFLASPVNADRGLRESPEWVLVESNVDAISWLSNGRNKCGIEAFQRALDSSDRQGAMRIFGHVLHILQDLAVPAHVRNDTHAPVPHPMHFLFNLFTEWHVDLRGDVSWDWFDPVESFLSDKCNNFACFQGIVPTDIYALVGRCQIRDIVSYARRFICPEVTESDPFRFIFECMRDFTATNFYSRDTILRNEVYGIKLDSVKLRDGLVLVRVKAHPNYFCLYNLMDVPVACVEEKDLEFVEHSGDRVSLSAKQASRLTRHNDFVIPDFAIKAYLRQVIPRLNILSIALFRLMFSCSKDRE